MSKVCSKRDIRIRNQFPYKVVLLIEKPTIDIFKKGILFDCLYLYKVPVSSIVIVSLMKRPPKFPLIIANVPWILVSSLDPAPLRHMLTMIFPIEVPYIVVQDSILGILEYSDSTGDSGEQSEQSTSMTKIQSLQSWLDSCFDICQCHATCLWTLQKTGLPSEKIDSETTLQECPNPDIWGCWNVAFQGSERERRSCFQSCLQLNRFTYVKKKN